MNNIEQLDMLRASKIGAELTPEQSSILAGLIKVRALVDAFVVRAREVHGAPGEANH